jgi:hypothetical protein
VKSKPLTDEVWKLVQQTHEMSQQAERERILELIKSYWCGQPDCKEHTTNWPHLIENIKGTK